MHDPPPMPDQIRDWWGIWPNANIGIASGRISGIIVIDADPRNGSNETLRARVKELGRLSRSVKARSGGGGTHRVYNYPDFTVKSNSKGKLLGPGLDVLSDGTYFVAPSSRHISGKTSRSLKDNLLIILRRPLSRQLGLSVCARALKAMYAESVAKVQAKSSKASVTSDLPALLADYGAAGYRLMALLLRCWRKMTGDANPQLDRSDSREDRQQHCQISKTDDHRP